MKVKIELYNGIPLSASIPKHVTCTVKEAQPPIKGIAATPKYAWSFWKFYFVKILLEMQVPGNKYDPPISALDFKDISMSVW